MERKVKKNRTGGKIHQDHIDIIMEALKNDGRITSLQIKAITRNSNFPKIMIGAGFLIRVEAGVYELNMDEIRARSRIVSDEEFKSLLRPFAPGRQPMREEQRARRQRRDEVTQQPLTTEERSLMELLELDTLEVKGGDKK